MSMIYVENTPNNTGVAVYGDHRDFEGLYEALHDIVGNEDEFLNHEMVRIRVLAVCYDLRHAMMGDREFEFVDNGRDDFKMRKLSVIAPDKNVYLKINVLWPELLFVMMALNDFILLYAKRRPGCYKSVLDRRNIWMLPFSGAFQSMVAKCMEETVPQASFTHDEPYEPGLYMDGQLYHSVHRYFERPVWLQPGKRLKSIPTMAKRLAEQGNEYMEARSEDCRSSAV